MIYIKESYLFCSKYSLLFDLRTSRDFLALSKETGLLGKLP